MRPIGLPPTTRRATLTPQSDLRPIILRMISTNSLAAFTAEVSRATGPTPARGTASAPAARAQLGAEPQKQLEALPPKPASPLPRGSLLDLRV